MSSLKTEELTFVNPRHQNLQTNRCTCEYITTVGSDAETSLYLHAVDFSTGWVRVRANVYICGDVKTRPLATTVFPLVIRYTVVTG